MKRFIFVLIAIAIFITGIYLSKIPQTQFFFQDYLLQARRTFTELTTKSPVRINSNSYMTEDYIKRSFYKDKIITTSPENKFDTKKTLSEVKESSLIGIRCTENIVRNEQGVHYFGDSETRRYDVRVKDEQIIKILRYLEVNLPQQKKPMNTRLCEAEDNKIIALYTAGDYSITSDPRAGNNILWAFAFSKNNVIFTKVIDPDNLFKKTRTTTVQKSENSYLNCNRPSQLTKNYTLYIECREIGERTFNYFTYQIDLQKGTIKVMGKCLNSYITDKWHTKCET